MFTGAKAENSKTITSLISVPLLVYATATKRYLLQYESSKGSIDLKKTLGDIVCVYI